MPRWYKSLGNLNKELRQGYYESACAKGYSPKVAKRIRDWGGMRRYQALRRFYPQIKDRPGEGAEFWRKRAKEETRDGRICQNQAQASW